MAMVRRIDPQGCGCGAPEDGRKLVGIDGALERMAQSVHPVPRTETVGLSQARGRVLAEPVRATAMTPPFDNAAMDGYALDSTALLGEGPWFLTVEGRVAAGRGAGAEITRAGAARIFTGAPVPSGADAVVMQEAALRRGDTICLTERPVPGQHVRRAGEDMKPGNVILGAGTRLDAAGIAACAAAGHGRVRVRQRLRVGLLVTGDEVQGAGSGLGAGHIWDVNTPMLTAALSCPSIELVTVRHGADSREGLLHHLADMSQRLDLIVTTGGVSVGEEDHMRPALAALDAEMLFAGVAMKPGKPVSLGRVGAAIWLGLPGNPLSAFVTWQLFGTAVLRALTGRAGDEPRRRHVVTAAEITRKPGRCELRPARLDGFDGEGREIAAFEPATHSGRVARLPEAHGLIFVPAEAEHLPAGALVEFQPFCE